MTIAELLNAKEGENIEFKEAKLHFKFDELLKYANALANRNGGMIVFGISDKRPRRIVGSQAFEQPERTRKTLIDQLHIGVDFELLNENGLRVLVFNVASRPIGLPVQTNGIVWWREGDSLIPMPQDVMRKIYAESGHDFSADICPGATIADLDSNAIEIFQDKWIKKTKQARLKTLSPKQLLMDCEAVSDEGVTYAALALFGKHVSLGRYLAQSETIFEYRSSDASGPAQQREEFREGFFLYYEKLWQFINLRNDKQHYQDGLFIFDIATFNERVVREAVLNAICHRNYQLCGSVFIRQYPNRLVIDSPGGFLPGIDPENILDRQAPRNRRIAEILAKCGLVERSGQGMNLIYEFSIKEAKGLPDFSGTDAAMVRLTLNGLVLDKSMLLLINKIGAEALDCFSTADFLIINLLSHGESLPENLHKRVRRLLDLGIIEKGSGNQYIFARRYYENAGKAGVHTRLSGLDKGYNMGLLLKHIVIQKDRGAPFCELQQVLPAHSRNQIKTLLITLRAEGKIRAEGTRRAARWFPTDVLVETPIKLRETPKILAESLNKEAIAPNGLTKSLNIKAKRAGRHTPKSNLDIKDNRGWLLGYIASKKGQGARFKELQQLLPLYSRNQIKQFLARLRAEGKIYTKGTTRAALWFSVGELAETPNVLE